MSMEAIEEYLKENKDTSLYNIGKISKEINNPQINV
jgi:predicted nucleotidyltransferase